MLRVFAKNNSLLVLLLILAPTLVSGNSQSPLLHSYQHEPEGRQVFQYTGPLTSQEQEQLQLHSAEPGNGITGSPENSRLLLIWLPEALRLQVQQLDLCIRGAWSNTWLAPYMNRHITLNTFSSPLAPGAFLRQPIPGPLLLSCSRLTLTSGETVSLGQQQAPSPELLNGLEFIEVPVQARKTRQHTPPVHPVLAYLPDGSLSFQVLSGGGGGGGDSEPDQHGRKKPPFFFDKWSLDISPFFALTARISPGYAESDVRSGRPVLRLIAREGLIIEAEDKNQQLVFRDFVPLGQASQWLEHYGIDSSILASLAAGEKTLLTSSHTLNVITMQADRFREGYTGTLLKTVPLYNLPVSEKRQGSPDLWGSDTATTENPTSVAHLSAVPKKLKTTSNKGDGSEQPEHNLHIHRRDGSCCPQCNFAPCSCPECISQPDTSSQPAGDRIKPGELLTSDFFTQLSSLALEFGLLLGLPPEFLASLSPAYSEDEKSSILLMKVLELTGDRLTIANLISALEKRPIGLVGSGLVCHLQNWALINQLDMQAPLDSLQRAEVHRILRGISNQYYTFGVMLGIPTPELHVIAFELENQAKTEPWLKAVLKSANPNLREICKALRTRSLCKNRLAGELEKSANKRRINMEQSWSELSEPDAAHIYGALREMRSEITPLSVQLGIPRDTREQLTHQYTQKKSPQEQLRLIIQKSDELGLLTRKKVISALKVLKENRYMKGLSRKWSVTPPSELTRQELWYRIAGSLEQNQPDLACIQTLLNNHWDQYELIAFALNQPLPKEFTSCSEKVSKLLIQAALSKEINMRSLTLLSDTFRLDIPEQLRHREPENPSRLLTRADLVPLLTDHRAKDFAHKTALLLGIRTTRDTPYRLWQQILAGTPFLQTGHLRQLFEPHTSLIDAINYLPIDTAPPEISLKGISPTAGEFSEFASELAQNQAMLLHFINRFQHLLQGQPRDVFGLLEAVVVDSYDSTTRKDFLVAASSYIPVTPDGRKRETTILSAKEGFSNDYICPITLEPMSDPVMVLPIQGPPHYFSKKALLMAVARKPENPLNREYLTYDTVQATPIDKTLRNKIQQWVDEQKKFRQTEH